MNRSPAFKLLLAAGCAALLAFPAAAAQVDCDSEYCFSPSDFSESLTGICITGLPDGKVGTMMLGSRILQPGDILTARQCSEMTFRPLRTEEDRQAELEYLPIFSDRVAPSSAMVIAVMGKEDKAPIAEDTALETYKNLPNAVNLKARDPEGAALTYTVTRQPRRGTIQVDEAGRCTYTPKKNKVGIDSFTYTAADPNGNVSREATVTVTILKPRSREQYTDTAGLSCQFSAEWMKNTGVFQGETISGQACFYPDKAVTRGEFMTMLTDILDLPVDGDLQVTGFTDRIPRWMQPYLSAAIRSGITAGLPDQESFGPDCPISGGEAAIMVAGALDLSPAESPREDVPAWAADAIAAMAEQGFSLTADIPLTRAQAAEILYGVHLRNRMYSPQ